MNATDTLKVDLTQFNLALSEYVIVCKRKLSEILNKKAFIIIRNTFFRTPKADRANIERDLEVAGYALATSKSGKVRKSKGKFKRGAAILSGTLANRIVNARRGAAGLIGLYGGEMRAATQKLIARRFSAVGSLRSGWVGSMRRLAKVVSGIDVPRGPRVKRPGRAQIAKDGWNPVVEFEYDLNTKRSGGIDPRVVSALQQAFDAEAASMGQYIAEKMNEATRPFNAK